MLFRKTLADMADKSNKTYYELIVKKSKNVKKLPYKVHPKGAVLLKQSSGSRYVQYAVIPAKEKIQILSSKLKGIGSMDTLKVSWKGKVGYVSLNRILAPNIIGRLKNIFQKPVKQADTRINDLNTKIMEHLKTVAQARSALPFSPPLQGLTIQIKGGSSMKQMGGVAFAYDLPLTKDSLAEFALGESKTKLSYWFAKVPESPILSDLFQDTKSFIFSDPYLQKFLDQVFNNYVDKTQGKFTLQTSVYQVLNPSNNAAKQFFMRAISGPTGAMNSRGAFNVEFYANGDPTLTLINPERGLCELTFSEEVLLKVDLIDIFNKKKACIVVENSMGSIAKIKGKTIRDTSIGLYHVDYSRTLSDVTELT